MEEHSSQITSLPSTPIQNRSFKNGLSKRNGNEFSNVIEILIEKQEEFDKMKDEIAKLKEILGKKNEIIKEQEDTIQKEKTDFEKEKLNFQSKINELNQTIAFQQNLNHFCSLDDVVENGKIQYPKLHGKTLLVNRFYFYNGKWFADGIEIPFKHPNFKVCIKESLMAIHLTTILHRILCDNLKEVILYDTKITFDDYKKLVSSCSLQNLHLFRVSVRNQNGIKMEIDQLWNEVLPNVMYLEHEFKKGELKPDLCQKLSQLPTFPNLTGIILRGLYDGFDLEAFVEFIQINPAVSFHLKFKSSSKFYAKIKEKEIIPMLPSTCCLNIYK